MSGRAWMFTWRMCRNDGSGKASTPQGKTYMVDPHSSVTFEADSVSSPDILGVDVVDVDVLNDDVVGSGNHPQSFALEAAARPNTHKSLVTRDCEPCGTGGIVFYCNLPLVGVTRVFYSLLSAGTLISRLAAKSRGGGAGEIKGFGKHDHTWCGIS